MIKFSLMIAHIASIVTEARPICIPVRKPEHWYKSLPGAPTMVPTEAAAYRRASMTRDDAGRTHSQSSRWSKANGARRDQSAAFGKPSHPSRCVAQFSSVWVGRPRALCCLAMSARLVKFFISSFLREGTAHFVTDDGKTS